MSRVAKFLRLRLGAKTHILLGLILVLLGLRYAWSMLGAVRMPAGAIPGSYYAPIAALTLLFLGAGGWRIWWGLCAKQKHWVEDPLGKK